MAGSVLCCRVQVSKGIDGFLLSYLRETLNPQPGKKPFTPTPIVELKNTLRSSSPWTLAVDFQLRGRCWRLSSPPSGLQGPVSGYTAFVWGFWLGFRLREIAGADMV